MGISLLRRRAQAPVVVAAPSLAEQRANLEVLKMVFDICKAANRVHEMKEGKEISCEFSFRDRGLRYVMLLRAVSSGGSQTARVDLVGFDHSQLADGYVAELLGENSLRLGSFSKDRASFAITGEAEGAVTSVGEKEEMAKGYLRGLYGQYFPNGKPKWVDGPMQLVDIAFDLTDVLGHASRSIHSDRKDYSHEMRVKVGKEDRVMKVEITTFTKGGVRNARITVFERDDGLYEILEGGQWQRRKQTHTNEKDAWKRYYKEIAYIAIGNVEERREGQVELAEQLLAELQTSTYGPGVLAIDAHVKEIILA